MIETRGYPNDAHALHERDQTASVPVAIRLTPDRRETEAVGEGISGKLAAKFVS